MKQIPSFPGYYADSNGDIYRLKKTGIFRILKKKKRKTKNYYEVNVYKDQKMVTKICTQTCTRGI